jgi:formiminoglutamate deiminase
MYQVAVRLTPELYEELATAVYAEMSLAGITAVGEFHYLHLGPGGAPYPDPNAMGKVLRRAAARAGVRMSLLDTCYLAAGASTTLDPAQRRFSDGDVASWQARVTAWQRELDEAEEDEDDFLLAAAIHSVRGLPPKDMSVVAAWAAHCSRPLHVHLSEQPAENEFAYERWGLTPTQILERTGALTPRTTVVHGNHLTEADIAVLGGAGVTVCSCPTTERDLGDGLAPIARLLAVGVHLALGTDQHVALDMFAEARGVEENERLAALKRGVVDPRVLVGALTVSGHAALGRGGDGVIAPGAHADLVAVNSISPRTAGCRAEQLVMCASAADITDVVSGGRHVVAGGRHALGDVGVLLDQAIAHLDGKGRA